MIWLILDSQRRNVFFQSPIGKNAQYVLDIGTGDGSWALDVADKFPDVSSSKRENPENTSTNAV